MEIFGLMIVKSKSFNKMLDANAELANDNVELINKTKDLSSAWDACKSNLALSKADNLTLKSKLVKSQDAEFKAVVALNKLRSEIEDAKTMVKSGAGVSALLTDAPAKPKPAKRKPSPKKRGGKK